MKRVYNRINRQQSLKGHWLNGKQAMKYLGMSSSTFYRYVDVGFITYRMRKTCNGSKRFYNTDDLDRFASPIPVNQFANL